MRISVARDFLFTPGRFGKMWYGSGGVCVCVVISDWRLQLCKEKRERFSKTHFFLIHMSCDSGHVITCLRVVIRLSLHLFIYKKNECIYF